MTPDHYVFRMLYSQGIALEDLGIEKIDGSAFETDPREIWRRFASHYHLFRGTPSRLWIAHCLTQPEYRPRALFDRFSVDVIATTEGALDTLEHHNAITKSGWGGRVITTYRPDAVIDPDYPQFSANLQRFAEITNCETTTW